jgi:hypothetical protein
MTEILRVPQELSRSNLRWVPGNDGGTYEDPIYHTVFLGKDRISVQESEHFQGTNRKTGNKYSRFRNNYKMVFSWSSGRLRVYEIVMPKRGKKKIFRDVTSADRWYAPLAKYTLPYLRERAPIDIDLSDDAIYPIHDPGGVRIREANDKDKVQRLAQHIAYPALRGTTMGAVPYMAPHLRERDLTAFARSAFKKNYRKDLVRWIARQPSIEPVYAAWSLQGIIPLEWIMDGMDGVDVTPFTPKYGAERKNLTKGMREFFGGLPERQARNLILDVKESGTMYIQDTAPILFDDGRPRYYRIPEDYRFTTWSAAHDAAFPPRQNRGLIWDDEWTYTALEPPKNEKIPQTKIAKKLDNLEVDGCVIHSAKETDELGNWGDYMHNCIGSYRNDAKEKRTNLFAIYRDEILVANMEIDTRGKVCQLFGKYNQSLDLTEGQKIIDAVARTIDVKQSNYTSGWMDF